MQFIASLDNLTRNLRNPHWTLVIDILIFIGVIACIIWFFSKRRYWKLGILLTAFILVHLAIVLTAALTENNRLYLSAKMFNYLAIFILLLIASVYQNEFKAFFVKLVSKLDSKASYRGETSDEELRVAGAEIVTACQKMAKNDVGALIVIAPTDVPAHVLDTGTKLDALVTHGLIESIFITKGPLHDGAIIIKGDKILSAGCFLPIAQETNIPKELGTRHRAAIGITEETDVLAIVVSEETGVISVVRGGRIRRYMTPEKLFEQISIVYDINYGIKDVEDY